MDGREGVYDSRSVAPPPAPVVVVGGEANPAHLGGSTVAQPLIVAQVPVAGAPPPAGAAGPLPAGETGIVTPSSNIVRKKRGRPRKYGPDGKVALSPMPISASIPLTGGYSGWKSSSQGKPASSIKRKQKLEFDTPGERVSYSVGANFTPHVITVGAGQDINMKIISFAQQGSRAICILAANGTISNVTLRQPNSCGGTLTYEGRFEILSLSGAFMPNDIGGAKGRSGGMSVSLAGPDGRVLGGGLAGMLVASGPVQVVIGSFLPGHQQEQQKPKKSRFEHIAAISAPPIAAAPPIFTEATAKAYGDESKLNFTPTNSIHGSRSLDTENNGSLQGSESKELNTSQCEVSC